LDFFRKPRELFWSLHLRQIQQTATQQAGQAFCALCFLPFEALSHLDAILRTLTRLWITRRHLLEWQTASDAAGSSPTRLPQFLREMWIGPVLAFALLIGLSVTRPLELTWA